MVLMSVLRIAYEEYVALHHISVGVVLCLRRVLHISVDQWGGVVERRARPAIRLVAGRERIYKCVCSLSVRDYRGYHACHISLCV